MDQRGFSPTAPTPSSGRYSVDVAVADIEAVRRAIGLDKFVLVGHSMHGTIALAYALAHPDRVLGVVGIGAPTAFDSTLAAATATYWEQEASPGRKERARRRLAAIPPDSLRRLASGPLMIATYVANGPRYWADSSYDASWLWKGMTPNTTLIGQLFDFTRPYRLPAASSTSSHRRRFGKDDRRPSGS